MRGVMYSSAISRCSSQSLKVWRKPAVMLPAPILAASASSRAIKARLRAGNC
ncbi:hypothetical protein D3C73_1473290 [compost metagenome]